MHLRGGNGDLFGIIALVYGDLYDRHQVKTVFKISGHYRHNSKNKL